MRDYLKVNFYILGEFRPNETPEYGEREDPSEDPSQNQIRIRRNPPHRFVTGKASDQHHQGEKQESRLGFKPKHPEAGGTFRDQNDVKPVDFSVSLAPKQDKVTKHGG